MARMFHVIYDGEEDFHSNEDKIIEEAFKEGCEHGYKTALKEMEEHESPKHSEHHKESFEEKIKKLKEAYK